MIDATKFEAQGLPTLDQARTVYDSLSHQTVDSLRAALTNRGFQISRATCARWIKRGFKPSLEGRGGKLNINRGVVGQVAPAVRAAIRAEGRESENLIGGEMDAGEISAIQADMNELASLDTPQLKAVLEKERLTYNIIMLRASKRQANKLALIPKDNAAFIVAMTDAAESVPTVPTGQLPGDGAKLIEATANPPNPVSDAIAQFKNRSRATVAA